jgi:hypothetical protein
METSGGSRSPVGRPFPSVLGTALSGKPVRLPGDLGGVPAVLLVAYQRAAQMDVDRWRSFLEKDAPGLAVYEVPTIPQAVWRWLAGWIDGGMRSGVPRELWPHVVTLYDEGAPVLDLLGDRGNLFAHVVLLDAEGVVRWFDASAFSAAKGASLVETLRGLEG